MQLSAVLDEQGPLLIEDLGADPRALDRAWARREAIRGFVGCPLISQQRAIGALTVFSRGELDAQAAEAVGVAADLICFGLERARAEGYRSISLSVDRNNARAIELYRRHGFEQAGEDDDSVTMLAPLA